MKQKVKNKLFLKILLCTILVFIVCMQITTPVMALSAQTTSREDTKRTLIIDGDKVGTLNFDENTTWQYCADDKVKLEYYKSGSNASGVVWDGSKEGLFGESLDVDFSKPLHIDDFPACAGGVIRWFAQDEKAFEEGKNYVKISNVLYMPTNSQKGEYVDIVINYSVKELNFNNDSEPYFISYAPNKVSNIASRQSLAVWFGLCQTAQYRVDVKYYEAGTSTAKRVCYLEELEDLDGGEWLNIVSHYPMENLYLSDKNQLTYKSSSDDKTLLIATKSKNSVDPGGNIDGYNAVIQMNTDNVSYLYGYGKNYDGEISSIDEFKNWLKGYYPTDKFRWGGVGAGALKDSVILLFKKPYEPKKIVSDSDESGESNTLQEIAEGFTYDITHLTELSTVTQSKTYYTSYEIEDEIEKCLDIKDVKICRSEYITDEVKKCTEDVTDKFDITWQDNKIVAKAKTTELENADFYNKLYDLKVEVAMKEDYQTYESLQDYVDKNGENIWLDESTIQLPNEAKLTICDLSKVGIYTYDTNKTITKATLEKPIPATEPEEPKEEATKEELKKVTLNKVYTADEAKIMLFICLGSASLVTAGMLMFLKK